MYEYLSYKKIALHDALFFARKQPLSGRSVMTDGALSARSTSGLDEGRPRWGDRGVATGRLWEPTAPTARLPQVITKNLLIITFINSMSMLTHIHFKLMG